jgi:GntR family transcriptional repressor for pyruvate dehydrogenase complex
LTLRNSPAYSADALSDKLNSRVNEERKETLADQLLTRLRQQILSGDLAPGQLVPTEGELCDAFGVARTTVREALRGLVGTGFAERRARRLVVVDRATLGGARIAFAELDARTAIRDLYEARKLIEMNAAERAAERWTGSDLDALRAMLDGMDPSDPDSFHRADTRFHIEIVRLAKNAILSEVFERSHELFFRMPAYWRVFGLPRGKAPAAHGVKWIHYRRIFSALRRRDGFEAREAMGALLDLLKEDLIRRTAGAKTATSATTARRARLPAAASARRG